MKRLQQTACIVFSFKHRDIPGNTVWERIQKILEKVKRGLTLKNITEKEKKIVKLEVLMKENKAIFKKNKKTIWAWLWNVFHPMLHMHCITVKKYYPFVAQDNTYALWNKPNNE